LSDEEKPLCGTDSNCPDRDLFAVLFSASGNQSAVAGVLWILD
jgi:hypothetical protein